MEDTTIDIQNKLDKILKDKQLKCPMLTCAATKLGVKKMEARAIPQQVFDKNRDELFVGEGRISVRFVCNVCETVFDKHYVSQLYIDKFNLFVARVGKELVADFLMCFKFSNDITTDLDLLHSNGCFGTRDYEAYHDEHHHIPHTRANMNLFYDIIARVYEFTSGKWAPLRSMLNQISNDKILSALITQPEFQALSKWLDFSYWNNNNVWKKSGKECSSFIRNCIAFHNVGREKMLKFIDANLANQSGDGEVILATFDGNSNNNFNYTFIGNVVGNHFDPHSNDIMIELIKTSKNAIIEIPRNVHDLFEKVCHLQGHADKFFATKDYISTNVVEPGDKIPA